MAEIKPYENPPRKPLGIGDAIKKEFLPLELNPKAKDKDREPPMKKAQSPDKMPKQQYT